MNDRLRAARRIQETISAVGMPTAATLLAFVLGGAFAALFASVSMRIRAGGWPAPAFLGDAIVGELTSGPEGIALGILSSSSGLLASLFLFRRLDRTSWQFHFRRSGRRMYVATILAMFGVSMVMSSLIGLLGLESRTLDDIKEAFGSLGFLGRLAMVPVIGGVAGTCEELFFRGYVLERTRQTIGDRGAIFLSAALFGVMHLDPVHAVAAGAMGAILGVMAVRAQSILPCIAAHVFNNSVVTILPQLEDGEPESRVVILVLGIGLSGLGLRLGPLRPPERSREREAIEEP